MRKHPPTSEIPVCILSSSTWHSDVERATSLGITRYFTKPINVDDVEQLSSLVTGSAGTARLDKVSKGVSGE